MGAERGYRCRRHHLNCFGFHCFFCTNECDAKCVSAFCAYSVYFLFTRLTNVGVFIELLASAIETFGCGDADDDRIYNKDNRQEKKKKSRVRKKKKKSETPNQIEKNYTLNANGTTFDWGEIKCDTKQQNSHIHIKTIEDDRIEKTETQEN